MSILDWLFGEKSRHKSIIWGVRTPPKVKQRWLMLASLMRIPANRLVLYILNDWAQRNSELLLDDEERNKLARRIADAYLENELE